MSNRRMQFGCRVFIVLLVGMHVSVLQAQIDHETIKKLALKVLALDGPDVRPSIQFRRAPRDRASLGQIPRGNVVFVLPRPKSITSWPGAEVYGQEDPFYFPLDEQLKLEIMRKYPPNALSHRVLNPYLDEIEKLIGQIIHEITSSHISKQLRRTNERLDRFAFEILDIYGQGISEYVRRIRRSLPESAPKSLPYYYVAFTSRPGGARIWLCPILEYRLAELQSKKVPWRLVPDPKDIILAGQYFYLLQWGDKSEVGKTAINIGRSRTYFLK